MSEHQLQGLTMGTSWNASCITDSDTADILQAEIEAALNEVDLAMSTYKTESEISRFNLHHQGIKFSAPSFYVISVALDIARKSAGLFDPTVMPLVNLWGFGPQHQDDSYPSAAAIAAAQQNCGYKNLILENDSFFIGKAIPELQLDLSAIAKGFGADNVAASLDSLKVENYMIEVGGEIRVKGYSAKGRPWRLAIDSPTEQGYSRIIELSSGAIATSGDYRNTRFVDGKLISHTIDPTTGYPVEHNLASASIVADNCTIADGMATACMVMGAEQSMRIIESDSSLEAYLIERHGEDEYKIWVSSGFPPALNLD